MSRPFATSNAVQRGGAVQNQLAALHRDKERLEKETEQIYRNKDVTLQQLDALKTKHRNLSAKEQEHQEKLGQFDGRKDMCLKEKARVQNELQQDHNALKQWDRQAVQVEQEETTRKQAHCKKMVELAEKLEDLILQLEFARLKSMVSAETVDVLFARRAPSHRGQDQDGLAGAAAHLKEVTAERDQEKASNAALVEQLDIFRKQVLESDNGLTRKAILDMEALWAEAPNGSGRDDMHHEKIPEHMEMFYGDGQDQGGVSMDDSTNSNHSYAESSDQHELIARMSYSTGAEIGSYGGTIMMDEGRMSGGHANGALAH